MNNPQISLMRWDFAKEYLTRTGQYINPLSLKFYINVEDRKKGNDLTEKDIFVSTVSLAEQLAWQKFREMECEVVQLLVDEYGYDKHEELKYLLEENLI